MKKEKILNLTQHPATPEQRAAGVVEPEPELKARIKALLTFDQIPTKALMEKRARTLAAIAIMKKFNTVMIGGAPYFMPILVNTLKQYGIKPVFAFSKRIVKETVNEKGEVIKQSVFKHEGFVEL